MADIELMHSAKGSTWQKRNAAYISRVKKNGKWVYTYATKKAGQAGRAVASNAGAAANVVKREAGEAYDKAKSTIARGKKRVNSILARMRKANHDRSIERARKSATKLYEKRQKQKSANRKRLYRDAAYGTKKDLYYQNNKDVQEAYAKGERGKTYDEYVRDNKKKYKKQAKAQRRSKNKIAREQAVGSAKRTAKAAVTKGFGSGVKKKR